MNNHTSKSLLALGLVIASASVYIGCGDGGSTVKEPSPDSGIVDSGGPGIGDGGTKDCFDNPTTHFEIINACTTATQVTKNPVLSKLLPDGGLPPLQ